MQGSRDRTYENHVMGGVRDSVPGGALSTSERRG